jgi:hypothetical protein
MHAARQGVDHSIVKSFDSDLASTEAYVTRAAPLERARSAPNTAGLSRLALHRLMLIPISL